MCYLHGCSLVLREVWGVAGRGWDSAYDSKLLLRDMQARVNYIDGEICIVHVGPGPRLIFVEDSDVADYHAGYEGWHLAIYISNFSAAFQAIEAAGAFPPSVPRLPLSISRLSLSLLLSLSLRLSLLSLPPLPLPCPFPLSHPMG
jgi:hypothetical protein